MKTSLVTFYLFLFISLFNIQAIGQSLPDTSWEKITPKSFEMHSSLIDSTTPAVELYREGNAEVNYLNGWNFIYKVRVRKKILKKSGYDFGKIRIAFSSQENSSKKLNDIKASTYNLVNGAVIETKLKESDFYQEMDKGDDEVVESFTFPEMKEGSIIEYSFTIRSYEISYLEPWQFQFSIPCLVNNFKLSFPFLMNYVVFNQGLLPIKPVQIDSVKTSIWTGYGNAYGNIYSFSWHQKSIPPLKMEAQVFCLNDYFSRIRFQIQSNSANSRFNYNLFRNWQDYSKYYRDRMSHGGLVFKSANLWLNKPEIQDLLKDTIRNLDHAEAIYNYVRNTFTLNPGIYVKFGDLNDVFKLRQGNEEKLNLILLAILKKGKYEADPVLISKREDGVLDPNFPDLNRFFYIAIRLVIGKDVFYLDPSRKELCFGKLLLSCYNGPAIVLNEKAFTIHLNPDTVLSSPMVSTLVRLNEKNELISEIQYSPDYYTSYQIRYLKNKDSLGYLKFLKNLKSDFRPSQVDSFTVNNLKGLESPIEFKIKTSLFLGSDKKLYFNPILDFSIEKNPFKSDKRTLPINLDSKIFSLIIFDFEIPLNFKLEDYPKSEKVVLNETDGYFEYISKIEDNHLLIRCITKLNRTNFMPDEYQNLRKFYLEILKKVSDQVVLTKI